MNTTTTTTTNKQNGGMNMENRTLCRAAARRVAAAELRNSLATAAPLVLPRMFGLAADAAAADKAMEAVRLCSVKLAAALSGKRAGQDVTIRPVDADALLALAVPCTLTGKLADGKRLVWNVRKEGYLKSLFYVSAVECSSSFSASDASVSDADYLAKHGGKAAARQPMTPVEKLAGRLYAMDKEASKAEFYKDSKNLDKEFKFACLADWKAANMAKITAAAAMFGIAA